MHVVRHQHVGMKRTTELVGKLFEGVQVELVVLFPVEADRTVIRD